MKSILRTRICAVSILAALLPAVGSVVMAQERLGSVDFPNSGAVEAQAAFQKGVLLLHSFEFDDSAIAFRDAQALDPDFALAYWGEAMTYNHPLWYQQDRDAALEVLGRLGANPGDRAAKAKLPAERDFLAAVEILYGDGDRQTRNVAYMNAMRRMYVDYPGNQEAATFYALSILGSSAEGRDYTLYMKAAAIAGEVYAVNPDHPGAAHYIIHSFDDPVHAPLGLPAARKYSQIAPDASHALHMPSHIFVALGMWDDVARMNVLSWEAGVKRVKKNNLPVAQNQYHAILWELYSRLQLGQYETAKKLISMVADDQNQSDADQIKYHLAMMRAAFLVEADAMDEDVRAVKVDPSRLSDRAAAAQFYADAQFALASGDLDAARGLFKEIEVRRRSASEKAENSEPAAVGRTRTDFVTTLVIEKELAAHLAAAEGKTDKAVSLLKEAVEMEDGLAFTFGPPTIVKPSAEALGELLLFLNRPAEAADAFDRALARAPGRSLSLEGLAKAAAAAGSSDRATAAERQLQNNWKTADSSHPGFD